MPEEDWFKPPTAVQDPPPPEKEVDPPPKKEEEPPKKETDDPFASLGEEDPPPKKEDEPPTKTPKESIQELRAKKDEWKNKAKDLEKKAMPEWGSKLIDHVKSIAGTEDIDAFDDLTIDDFIEKHKESVEGFEDLKKKNEELETKLRDVNIRYSPDFQENYENPAQQALEDFAAILSPTDHDMGKPYLNALGDALVKQTKDGWDFNTDIKSIKGVLEAFSSKYEENTEQVYNAPSALDVQKAINNLKERIVSRESAIENWDEEQKNKKENLSAEEKEKQRIVENNFNEERKASVVEYINEFDFDVVAFIGDKKEIGALMREQDKLLVDRAKNPDKFTYKDYLSTFTKAAFFDKIMEDHKVLIEDYLKDEMDKGEVDSSGVRTSPRKVAKEAGKDAWSQL